MGERRRATCSHADCFAKWRGAVGRIMACSGHGEKTTGWDRPCLDRTLGLFERNAYRWWPKESGYGGGRSWRGRKVSAGWKGGGIWRMEKMSVVTRCSRLGKQGRGRGRTNKRGVGMWVHWLKGERGEGHSRKNEVWFLAAKKNRNRMGNTARRGRVSRRHYDFGEQVESKFKLKPRQRATHTCLVHFTRDLSSDPHLSDNTPLPRHRRHRPVPDHQHPKPSHGTESLFECDIFHLELSKSCLPSLHVQRECTCTCR